MVVVWWSALAGTSSSAAANTWCCTTRVPNPHSSEQGTKPHTTEGGVEGVQDAGGRGWPEHENADETTSSTPRQGRCPPRSVATPQRARAWAVHRGGIGRTPRHTAAWGSSDPRMHGSSRCRRPRAQIQLPPPPARWNPNAAAARVPGSGHRERRGAGWTGVRVTWGWVFGKREVP